MATKLQRITQLSYDSTKELSSQSKWTNFLSSAAWHYKYPFEDQVLIYAQRPDATACADFDTWSTKLNRRINRGAKGIALLREQGNEYFLDHVFDISDTTPRTRNAAIKLWEYNDKYDDAIIETLENTFGELKITTTLTDAIICAAHNAFEDNKADYLSELRYTKGDSFLAELDELNVDVEFQQTAEASVAYMIMQRMGLHPEDVFENEEFRHIIDFNTIETMSVLGNAVGEISEQALREISSTIVAEAKKEQQQAKKFAENKNLKYNNDKEETQPQIHTERNDINDRGNLQERERDSDTELGSTEERTPDTHTLTTSNQTTVTVLDKENKGVENVSVTVTDKNKATATKSTDTNGKVTLPVKLSGGGSSSGGGGRGGSSGGSYISSNITNITVTDKNGKTVSVSKSTDKDGKITLTLPNGADLTGDNYYTIKATDSKGNAKADVSIILKDKKNNSANGTTDKNGMLILPASEHKAYIFGYNDGTFRPDNNMSRAEAAAIFARLISEQKGEKISGKSNFNDVSKNEWYSDYIGYLSKYGIIKGYSNSTFRPDDNVSRAEFVAMTVRFNSLFNDVKKGSYTVKYTDVASNYWAYSDVAYAKNVGWISGYADGSFKGDNAITRAEVVTVVNRATGRKADEGYITKNVSVLNKFTDIRNNSMWYYADVMEAANTHLANSSNDTETWVK